MNNIILTTKYSFENFIIRSVNRAVTKFLGGGN